MKIHQHKILSMLINRFRVFHNSEWITIKQTQLSEILDKTQKITCKWNINWKVKKKLLDSNNQLIIIILLKI